MRVAILGPLPRSKNRIIGGVEAVVSYLSEELVKFPDVDLHIITCPAHIRSEAVNRRDGLTVHYLPRTKRLATLTNNWADERRIGRKVKEIDPDVVHAHDAIPYGGGALRSGYPSVLTQHSITRKDWGSNPGIRNYLRSVLGARYTRRVIGRVGALIACTPYVLEEFGSIAPTRVHVVEYPIHRRFYDIENKWVPNRLLLAARVIPRKCVLELLKSIKEIRERVPDVELRIAGEADADPSYLRTLLVYVTENNLQENVRFLGSLDEQSLLDEYASCSLLVLASKQETSPMAIHQAMAAGKAVVSTDVCGIPYLVQHGETGLLVRPGDVSGFADAVVTLLRDDGRREEMGRRARSVAQRFRSEEIATRHYEVYRGMLNLQSRHEMNSPVLPAKGGCRGD